MLISQKTTTTMVDLSTQISFIDKTIYKLRSNGFTKDLLAERMPATDEPFWLQVMANLPDTPDEPAFLR